jgi:hypothetical protein
VKTVRGRFPESCFLFEWYELYVTEVGGDEHLWGDMKRLDSGEKFKWVLNYRLQEPGFKRGHREFANYSDADPWIKTYLAESNRFVTRIAKL